MAAIRQLPMPLGAKVLKRFNKFHVPGLPDACWPWKGATTGNGRGEFGIGKSVYMAPRIAYAIHHGVDPYPLHTLHTCDNPRCVNPAHLWLGTHTDNMRDRWAKGNGMSCIRRKIWREEAEEIKKLRSQGVTWAAIAIRFEIGTTTISRALRGNYPWRGTCGTIGAQ